MWLARAGALSGALYVVLAVGATGGGGDSNSPNLGDSGETIARYYAAHLSSQRPHFIEAIALIALLFFIGFLWGILRRVEPAPAWLSATALGSGVALIAVKLASFPAFFPLAYHDFTADPVLARTLFEMNGLAFLVTWFLQAGLMLAAGAVSILYSGLPLWLGLPAALNGLALLLAASVAISSRNEVIVPELIWLLWLLVTSVYLAIRPIGHPGRQ